MLMCACDVCDCVHRLQKRGSSVGSEQLTCLHLDVDTLVAVLFVLQRCGDVSCLDLHGLRAVSAVMAVEWCVMHAANQGLTMMNIITGKGVHSKSGSVLKPAVYNALVSSVSDAVLAKTGVTLCVTKLDGSISVTLSSCKRVQ